MKNFDYSGLDPSLLQSLIAVYETGKVSDAADELNISQSALSHRIERAREIIGDPLFVRAGRNIQPTLRLRKIIPVARSILSQIHSLLEPEQITYSEICDSFAIAATDYERNVLLLGMYRNLHTLAPLVKLDFVWQKYDTTRALRKNIFDMAISPFEGLDSTDVYQRILFEDQVLTFYDPNFRSAPDTLESFLRARHVRVKFSKSDSSFTDITLQKVGRERIIALDLPSISEVPSVLRGTDLIATLPSKLKHSIMTEFETCLLPFHMEPLAYKLFWHEQTHMSKKHQWLRKLIIDQADSISDQEIC